LCYNYPYPRIAGSPPPPPFCVVPPPCGHVWTLHPAFFPRSNSSYAFFGTPLFAPSFFSQSRGAKIVFFLPLDPLLLFFVQIYLEPPPFLLLNTLVSEVNPPHNYSRSFSVFLHLRQKARNFILPNSVGFFFFLMIFSFFCPSPRCRDLESPFL